jgi:hypothetical protein
MDFDEIWYWKILKDNLILSNFEYSQIEMMGVLREDL